MRKKLLSLALALVMCLGLAVPAMAAYEVKSDKCTYELSNDPIGTVEYNFREWDWENSTDVYVSHTVYIVPDNTTVTSKTAPNGRMPYDTYDPRYSEGGGGNWMNEGEPFVVKPYEEEEVPDENWQVVIAKIPYIYIVKSEDMGWDEFGKPEMPFAVDEGIYVVAASAAAEMGLAAQTPSTPETPTTPVEQTPSTGFTDVAADAYYAVPVTWAVKEGITKGTDDVAKKFSPGQDCANAQILTFLWRAYGEPEPSVGNPFTNSIPDAYTKAAVWAYEKGMVSGTVFDVDKPCTRAMAVTYMWQAAGSPMPSLAANFTDVSADASYALAVAWALEKGVTTGTSVTTFSPDGICNRGQIVTFLHRNLA